MLYRLSYDCRYQSNCYSYKVNGIYDIPSAIRFLFSVKNKKYISFQKFFLNDTEVQDKKDSVIVFSGSVSENELIETATQIQTNIILLFASFCGEPFAVSIDTANWQVFITLQKGSTLDVMEIESQFGKQF